MGLCAQDPASEAREARRGASTSGEVLGRGGVVRAGGSEGVSASALHWRAAVRDPDPVVGACPGQLVPPARLEGGCQ